MNQIENNVHKHNKHIKTFQEGSKVLYVTPKLVIYGLLTKHEVKKLVIGYRQVIFFACLWTKTGVYIYTNCTIVKYNRLHFSL